MFLNLARTRQSVRKYLPREVEKEKIERCLEAVRLAPSASNGQPWKFIVTDKPELLHEISQHTYGPLQSFNKFVNEAPVIVVVVLEKMKLVTRIGANLKERNFSLIDIGIAAEHFCLQAAEEGLGTCMLGWFDEHPIKKLLKIPQEKRIALLITLGYCPEDYPLRKKQRKKIDQIHSYNAY